MLYVRCTVCRRIARKSSALVTQQIGDRHYAIDTLTAGAGVTSSIVHLHTIYSRGSEFQKKRKTRLLSEGTLSISSPQLSSGLLLYIEVALYAESIW